MGWESFGVVRFNLRPLLQGQTREDKLKSAYNWFIICPSGLGCEINLLGNLLAFLKLMLIL